MRSRLFALAYRLQIHELGGWSLLRWVATVGLLTFLVIAVPWLVRGRPTLSWLSWLAMLAGLAASAGIWLLATGARLSSYVWFVSQPSAHAPAAAQLDPEDKVSVRASGLFEVEGRQDRYANLLAYWRSFATREHTVMAIVHATRFLGVGQVPLDRLGMCYIFIQPELLLDVEPGVVSFGSGQAPGLALRYRYPVPQSQRRRRKKPKIARDCVYLAFADEASRDQVWADLLAGS